MKRINIPGVGLVDFPDNMTDEQIISAIETDILKTAPQAKNPERTLGGTLQDAGVTALKSAIAVPETAVGLADLVTGGKAGKIVEDAGIKFGEAKEILDTYKSDAQKAAEKRVNDAEGFVDTVKTAVQNPSVIASTIGESVAPMLAGGLVGRGILASAPKLSKAVAGAVGEGVIGAGSAAESTRQQTQDGELTAKQSALAAASGAGTSAFGALGGKVANKLGIGDIDTAIVSGGTEATTKSLPRRLAEGAFAEGVLEELPQSVQEQILSNAALNKPLLEGVDNAAALGLLAGAGMGAGAQLLPNSKPKLTVSQGTEADDVTAARLQAEYEAQQQAEQANAALSAINQAQSVEEAAQLAVAATESPLKPIATQAIPATDILGEENEQSISAVTAMADAATESASDNTEGSVGTVLSEPERTGMGAASGTSAPSIGTDLPAGTAGSGDNAVNRPFATASDAYLEQMRTMTIDEAIIKQIDEEVAARAGNVQNVTVDDLAGKNINNEWVEFKPETGTLAIPRDEMPQIKAEHRGAMVNFLNAREIEHQQETIPALDLKPTQLEFSSKKVEKAKSYEGGNRSILISSDNHVLDGHHQWLASLDKGENIDVIRLNAPINQLLNEIKDFPSATTADGTPLNENTLALNEEISASRTVAEAKKALTKAQISGNKEAVKAAKAKISELEKGTQDSAPIQDGVIARVGVTPKAAEPVTIRNGVIYVGNEPALNFETGDDVTVQGNTFDDVKKALSDAGVLSSRQKVFSVGKQSDQPGPNNAEQAPNIETPKEQKPKVTKPYKPKSLLSTMKELGGIALSEKQDVTGERRGFAPGGYNQIFKSASTRSLKGLIESGDLDDYLPYNMRLSASTMNDDAYDSTEAYDYLADRIRNGEQILPYEVEEEARNNQLYQKQDATADADAELAADLLTEDEINEQIRIASNEEREAAAEAKIPVTESEDGDTGSSTGTQESAETNTSQQAEVTQTKTDLLGEDTRAKQALADVERAKDAKRNSGTDNQDTFTLTGSNSEADQAAAAGAQDLFAQPAAQEKTQDEVAKAAEALTEAGVTGKERLDTIKDVRQGNLTADEVAEAYSEKDSDTTPLTQFNNAMDDYANGVANVDDYKNAFNYVLNNENLIKEYLSKNFTKQQLFDRGGRALESRYKSETKDRVVSALYSDMVSDFLLPNESGMTSYSAGFGESRYKGIKSQVDAITQDSLDKAMQRQQQTIEKNKEAQAERLKGIDDPKTLDDFTNLLRSKMAAGMSLKDARLSLTPEQRATYDSLYADKTIAERTGRKEAEQSNISVAGQTVSGNIIETKHTKKLTDLFVVQLSDRVSKEDYNTLNTGAKKLGGYYSSFRGAGAVPGFQFTTRDNAEAFVKLAGGDNTAAKEQSKEFRDSFADDKSQSAVERLTEMSDRLQEKADEELNRERKVNTSRRAGMAARAEANASAQKAMAITMRNIADAIQNKTTKYLGKVRQKVQVELLQSLTSAAQYTKLREQYPAYSDYEKNKDEPPTIETADYAEFPSYSLYRSDLASLGRKMVAIDGLKLLGNRILSVADDVTDAYLKFAKDNIDKVSNYRDASGQRAVFSSKALAEQAIARSGFNGKAIVLPFKRGENLIIDSPSASKERGVWPGDDDKKITLSPDFGKELVEKIGKANRKTNKLNMPWQFENAYDKREKLARMGIENPAEMRAALREFIELKETAKQPDKIKELERQMIGRKNDGLDFFPTPISTSDEMIETADIKEGMKVLEPSAGMGHIAERIRSAGFEPDVVEFSGDRRELLELKGFNVVGSNFLDITEKYDRIIMNPPFSNRRDEEHVRHAYNLLKPNGKLVAIMGEGVFFGSDKRATEFREWLESVGGTSEKLDEGTFNDASLPVNTSVNARMVVIEKLETSSSDVPMFSRSNPNASLQDQLQSIVDGDSTAKGNVLTISENSPASLQMFGFNNLPVVTRAGADGVLKMHYEHGLSVPKLASVIENGLKRPAMILQHKGQGDIESLRFVTNEMHNGNPVILAIQPEKQSATGRVQLIATAFEVNAETISKSIMNGDLLYRDTTASMPDNVKKAVTQAQIKNAREPRSLLGIIPNSAPSRRQGYKVLSQSDIVKFENDNEGSYFSRTSTPTFYSQLSRAINEAKQDSMPAKQWAAWLTANAGKLGIKKDELQWTGVNEWLELQTGKVGKSDILAYLDGNGLPLFKRDTSISGMPTNSVQSVVDALRKNWTAAPEIIVVESMQDSRIPQAVRAENDRQLSQGATGEPEGFYYKGSVYVISSQMNSAKDVERVVLHETLGHFGLRKTFGKELESILKQLAVARTKDVKDKAASYGLNPAKESDRLIAAEEVLAEMAQNNPQAGFVKRAIAAVRNWLRKHGFNLQLTDNDIVVNYLLPARAYVENGQAEQNVRGLVAAFNRNGAPSDAKLFQELTANDEMFKYGKSDAMDLQQVFDDVAPELVKVERTNIKDDDIQDFYNIYPIDNDGNVRRDQPGQIMVYKDGKVELNVLRWNEGFGGSGVYAAVGNWAYNNELVFAGDREGITPVGKLRRLENMISLALKFGTTDHIMPHPEQMEELNFDWRKGDFEYNLGQMLEASYNAIRNGVYVTENNGGIENTYKSPDAIGVAKLDDLVYDFDKQQFIELSNGANPTRFTDKDFQSLAGTPEARAVVAGRTTLKRAAIAHTFVRAQGAERKRLLELIGRLSLQRLDGTTQLEEIFYSRSNQTDTPQFKAWFGDSKVVDADGKPLVVYHGTDVEFDIFDYQKLGRNTMSNASDPAYGATSFIGAWFNSGEIKTSKYNPYGKFKDAYLKIENPIYYANLGDLASDMREIIPEEYEDTDEVKEKVFEWVRKQKQNGYDGIVLSDEEFGGTSYIAFEANQIKSATDNNGDFDAANPDIRFSRSNPQSSLTPEWKAPDASKFDSVVYALQDKHVDLKRVTQAIKDAGNEISDRWNAYLQEELYHGRTAKRIQEFIKGDLEPLIEDMRMRGVAMADLEMYLWARHAEERNIQIAKVNPQMQDGGSGLTTQEANDYLDNLSPEDKKRYQALAKRIDNMVAKSRQVLLDYGLESADTIAAWEGAYENYVPLMREDMDTLSGTGTGQGFSVKGNSSKRATGSSRPVVDIIANIAQQYERNIIRGEKNRVSTALIGLATLNPNDDFWLVDKPPTIKEISKATGLVEERTDPNYKNRDNVVVARIPNKLGKIVERSVIFNQFDERAMRMARSIKNLDQDQVSYGFGTLSAITRYFASINTQYNPIFGVMNITRDVQGAVLNLESTPIAGKKQEVLSNTFKALGGIYSDLRKQRKSGQASDSEWAQLFEEFQREGGQTGYRDMFANASDRSDAIRNALDPTWWKDTKIGKLISAKGMLADGEQYMLDKGIKPVFDWLSDYNTALENSVRLSAYKVAIDSGLSKQQAASIAKNLTVNFNRKGQLTRNIGALYAFFNASVQGTARIAENMLLRDARTGKISLSKAGKAITYGGLLLGAMQAMILAAAGYDDDEPPQFVRDRNLVIPLDMFGADNKYVTIPMPLGYNAIPATGRMLTEWAMSGFEDTPERLVKMLDMILDVTNPIGNAGLSMQTLAPTVLDPLAALTENKDFTGRPISRDNFSAMNPTPGFTRSRDKAWDLSVSLAKGINWATGGTDAIPGAISPTADQIEYLTGQVTGGVGREAIKIGTSIDSLFTGEELPTYKIPLVGRFFGDASSQSSQGAKFYNNVRKLNEHQNQIKFLQQNGGNVAEYIKENPEARLGEMSDSAYFRVQALRKRQRELKERNASRDKIKLIDQQITNVMRQLNERYEAMAD